MGYITKTYNEHFLLDMESVKKYALEVLDYFPKDAILDSLEIGDGNINYIFKVWDIDTKKSLVIKQADKYLRSSGRQLDI